jgi:hypothetical protein
LLGSDARHHPDVTSMLGEIFRRGSYGSHGSQGFMEPALRPSREPEIAADRVFVNLAS